jgi:hypothetical protein
VQSTSFNEQMRKVFNSEIANSKLIDAKTSKKFLNFVAKFQLMIFNLYKPLL